jgi:hypothetical protein
MTESVQFIRENHRKPQANSVTHRVH